MLCNECNENEAKITYTTIIDNKMEEAHICEECMQKLLSQDFAFPFSHDPNMAEFLQEIFSMFSTGARGQKQGPTCPSCGYRLEDFHKTSLLGCPDCYRAFEKEIKEILPRFQGASSHKGYVPKNFEQRSKKKELLETFLDKSDSLEADLTQGPQDVLSQEALDEEELEQARKALELAVSQERYEDAALYRDQIRQLEARKKE